MSNKDILTRFGVSLPILLNHEQCLEILVVRGQIQRLRELTNLIHIQKGVSYAELSVTYLDKSELESSHGGHHHA